LPKWFNGADPYVILLGSEIIGTGTVRGRDIQTVFILPEHHGKGYVKQIMSFLEQRIRAKGFDEITLNSSLTSKDFYLSLGYICVAETHGAVGGNMISMTKKL
jgi:citrate lyase synthetase